MGNSISKLLFIGAVIGMLAACKQHQQNIYSSSAFTITHDSLTEKQFVAKALSPDEMLSNYKSPFLKQQTAAITFKFSINGDDNEMTPGWNHHINCPSANCSTAPIPFGQPVDTALTPSDSLLKDGTVLHFKVDMNNVLDAFKKQGYYTTDKGEKIYKNDFKGVYVAGDVNPLTWDFANLANHQDLQLKDPDRDGIYTLDLPLKPEKDTTASHWKLSADLANLPSYKSDHTLVEALYNLSLEEMLEDIRQDSTFMAGAKWDGVWTRDVSYSTILSLAILKPQICRNSLLRKVKNGKIIQDTGTGGSYPVSTDRMVWTIAAWEIYKVTGDRGWLKQAYQIISNSAAADEQNIYDPRTGLVHGESSFMDWREQSYPKWMQPVDIFNSECLSTNAVHYETNIILAQMADLLADHTAAGQYSQLAKGIRQGINKYLWQADKGYYGEYLYGHNFLTLSPKSESLGEALTVLFNIASPKQQKSAIGKTPVLAYGVPCFYPQITGIPPYHNDAIWPFVDAYWTLAAAKVSNEKAVMAGMSSIYRAAALFLTNKENMIAESGDYIGTQINSSRQLWSVAGNLAMVYKVIFGMQFGADSLHFAPFIPKTLGGKHMLNDFHYRNATLSIDVEGYGNEISQFSIDGQAKKLTAIPGNISGRHKIHIVMGNKITDSDINLVKNHFSPETPALHLSGNELLWAVVPHADHYKVLKNGQVLSSTKDTIQNVDTSSYAEYQLIAVDSAGFESFASEALINVPADQEHIYQAENIAAKAAYKYQGFSGNGFVEISTIKNKQLRFNISVPEAGLYAIDFRYANGNGPINTDNKCAMRSLLIDRKRIGTEIFPQRGQDQWSNWGFSNALTVILEKGQHLVSVDYQPANINMNGDVNQAMLDYLRLRKIK